MACGAASRRLESSRLRTTRRRRLRQQRRQRQRQARQARPLLERTVWSFRTSVQGPGLGAPDWRRDPPLSRRPSWPPDAMLCLDRSVLARAEMHWMFVPASCGPSTLHSRVCTPLFTCDKNARCCVPRQKRLSSPVPPQDSCNITKAHYKPPIAAQQSTDSDQNHVG